MSRVSTTSGTLKICRLAKPVAKPENQVSLADISFDRTTPIQTIELKIDDIDRIVQIDITEAAKDTSFRGIVLASDNGLSATFRSRESGSQPMIMLSNEIVAGSGGKWLTGNGAPTATAGANGDSYIDTASGNMYSKATDAWSFTVSMKGPKGENGERGSAGEQGPKGDKGENGIQGPAGVPPAGCGASSEHQQCRERHCRVRTASRWNRGNERRCGQP